MLIEFFCDAEAVNHDGEKITDLNILKKIGQINDNEADISNYFDYPLDQLGIIDAGIEIYLGDKNLKAVFRFRTIDPLNDNEMQQMTEEMIGQILDGYGENGLEIEDNPHTDRIWFVLEKLDEGWTIQHKQTDDGIAVPDLRPSPLLNAAERGDLEAITQAIKNKEDLSPKDRWGMTPLMIACREKQDDLVFALLKAGVDPSYMTRTGSSATSHTAMVGGLEVMKALLDAGADINPNFQNVQKNDEPFDHNDTTPLMWAANRGHQDIVQLLLERGADVNQQTEDGKTALMYCHYAPIIHDLISAGGDVLLTDSRGMTALDGAREQWKFSKTGPFASETEAKSWNDVVEALKYYQTTDNSKN